MCSQAAAPYFRPQSLLLLQQATCTLLATFARSSSFLVPFSLRREPPSCSRHLGEDKSMRSGRTAVDPLLKGTAPADARSWQAVEGLSDIASRYDVFLIDQWGVMHDGNNPYPGAAECIERLEEAGKTIILLSNSSKRKGAALDKLKKMGFSTSGILDVVTSGEIAWDGLQRRVNEPFRSLGTKCLVFGNGDDDLEYVSSCGCEIADAESADFILARGSFVIVDSAGSRRYGPTIMTGEGKEEVDRAMQMMLARGAKMLVTNPDFVRPGTNDPMPGLIGQAYADSGGTTYYVGKPHALVYEACWKAVQAGGGDRLDGQLREKHGDLATIAAVGDSLPHDILGAIRTGIQSVFVAGGVHFKELGVGQGAGGIPSDDAYSALFENHLQGEGLPTHVLSALRW